mmetsp:Transcript_13778/g.25254  ORF Transcript_13778/g.25254 Transcript_13778/m.25254 type:complete len:324 (-) Transcript_13778:963-1934(-)
MLSEPWPPPPPAPPAPGWSGFFFLLFLPFVPIPGVEMGDTLMSLGSKGAERSTCPSGGGRLRFNAMPAPAGAALSCSAASVSLAAGCTRVPVGNAFGRAVAAMEDALGGAPSSTCTSSLRLVPSDFSLAWSSATGGTTAGVAAAACAAGTPPLPKPATSLIGLGCATASEVPFSLSLFSLRRLFNSHAFSAANAAARSLSSSVAGADAAAAASGSPGGKPATALPAFSPLCFFSFRFFSLGGAAAAATSSSAESPAVDPRDDVAANPDTGGTAGVLGTGGCLGLSPSGATCAAMTPDALGTGWSPMSTFLAGKVCTMFPLVRT